MAFKTHTLIAIFVIVLAVYLNYPAPPLSENLKKWKESGKIFKFGNKNIFYHDEVIEGKRGPVLLCIHGFPTSSFDFVKILPYLKEDFGRIIAADMLGFGFSDKPKGHNYTVFEQADILTALIQNLHGGDFYILAHDLGDTVAQELLVRAEEGKMGSTLIRSITFLNGGILPETNFPKTGQKLLLNEYVGPVLARLVNYMFLKKSLSDVFGQETQPTEAEFADFYSLIRWNDGHLVLPGLLQYINQRHVNRDRWVHVLQNTIMPLHLIYGPSDPINGPDTFLKRYRKLVPRSGVDVLAPSISHYPHWEDPVTVARHYRLFVKPLLAKE